VGLTNLVLHLATPELVHQRPVESTVVAQPAIAGNPHVLLLRREVLGNMALDGHDHSLRGVSEQPAHGVIGGDEVTAGPRGREFVEDDAVV
jgi:hypothetical protein